MREAFDETRPEVTFRRELPRDAAIVAFAQTRHGVITSAELRAFGLSQAAVTRRAREGRLFRLYRGVYSVGRPDLTAAGHRMAAVLACGPSALLSHRSSAAQHGLLDDHRKWCDVTVRGAPRRPRRSIRVHSSTTLSVPETTTVDAVPCTSVARTLVDLGDREPPRLVERALDQAETHGVFDLAAVEDVLERVGPRRATGVLRRLLAELGEPALTDRELEELFLQLIRDAGLPAPAVNTWITGDGWAYKADFLWRAERLVVETDSRAFHTSRHAFEHDRLRDQRLTLAGYTVVRFTWRQVTGDPAGVAGTLAALLARVP
jgi:very-short-patch-repair endonuclease/predicted transcriptional regulator of viral defense system